MKQKNYLLNKNILLALALLLVGGKAWAEDISVSLDNATCDSGVKIEETNNVKTNIGSWSTSGASVTLSFTITDDSKYALMFEAATSNANSPKVEAEVFNSSNESMGHQTFDIVNTGQFSNYYNTYSLLTSELAAGEYTVKFKGTYTGGSYVCNMKNIRLRPEADFFTTGTMMDLSKASYPKSTLEGSGETANLGSIAAQSNALFNVKVTEAKSYILYFNASNNDVAGSTITAKMTNEAGESVLSQEFSIPTSGDWKNYVPYIYETSELTAGNYVLTFSFDNTAHSGNVANLKTVQVSEEAPSVTPIISLSSTAPTRFTLNTTWGKCGNDNLGRFDTSNDKVYYNKAGAWTQFTLLNARAGKFLPSFRVVSGKGGAAKLTIMNGETEVYKAENVTVPANSGTVIFPYAELPVSTNLIFKIELSDPSSHGDWIADYTDIKMTPYAYLVSQINMTENDSKELVESLAFSTDGATYKGETEEHGRVHAFANVGTEKAVVYYLYSETEQEMVFSGEGGTGSDNAHLTFTLLDENGSETSVNTIDFEKKNDWSTWTPYITKITLPAGLTKLTVSPAGGAVNFTAPTISTYDAFVRNSGAITVSETTLTYEQATTTMSKNKDDDWHNKAAYFFANNNSGSVATYDLYFPTEQNYTVSGELASNNGITHTLTYTFTSKEGAFTEKTFTKDFTSLNSWEDWKSYSETVSGLKGLVTLKITYTKSEDSGYNANFTAPTFTPQSSILYTIPASGMGTYCSAKDLDFASVKTSDNEAVIPYYIKSDATVADSKITATKVDGAVPAKAGIIIKGKGGETVTIPVATSGIASVEDNKLVGVTEATKVTIDSGSSYYVLSGGQLKKVTDEGTISPNRAYLKLEGGSAKFLILSFDDDNTATAIEHVETMRNGENETMRNGEMYNLAGQRVGSSYKGIVIVNGKKMLRK